MIAMITVIDLSKSYGSQTLFDEANFQLNPGRRYGLVGANGCGKSTLLRILTGEEEASTGSVSMPKRLRLGTLSQDHFQYEDTPILDVTMMGHEELWSALAEKERILEAAADHFDGDRYAEVEDIIVSLDGYGFEARAGEILEGLGIPTAVHRQPLVDPVRRLQAARAAGPGPGRRPGLPAARRADQPPRHPVDPLAGEVSRPPTPAVRW